MEDKERIEKGWIQTRVMIEIIGKPKEYVEKTSSMYLEKIKQDKNIELLDSKISPVEEVSDMEGFFGSIMEIEMWISGISLLAGFCFDFMPSSVEILEPAEMRIKERDLSSLFNDLQQKLHSLDMGVKQLRLENQHLVKNTHQLLENIVILMLMNSSYTAEEMAKSIALPDEQMKGFLSKLEKKGLIKKEDNKFILVKK